MQCAAITFIVSFPGLGNPSFNFQGEREKQADENEERNSIYLLMFFWELMISAKHQYNVKN